MPKQAKKNTAKLNGKVKKRPKKTSDKVAAGAMREGRSLKKNLRNRGTKASKKSRA